MSGPVPTVSVGPLVVCHGFASWGTVNSHSGKAATSASNVQLANGVAADKVSYEDM